ncbi:MULTISPECIES: M15 family metallopeptidase [Clostridium]|uniref:M15 family metallopeptidase n=1 Tax=Clostridium TaxID=1485 RepID=UPI000CF63DF3|nr:M15 family metallopeptidase [Clostridium cagae]NFT07362.1 D-alanyl-D-alanine carboxypeptidase family protein [Clostridium botulinum]
MKKILKKILIFIIVIGGLFVCNRFLSIESEKINIKDNKFNLNNNDKLINEDNDEIILVNRKNGLDKEYKPENLTIPNIPFTDNSSNEEKHVAGIIAKPLEELVNIAKKDGITLLGNSAYRSYKSQKNTYNNRVKTAGKENADAYVAEPGFSEHQTGMCIDITNEDKYFLKGTKEADWLAENCYRFGFIIRYPYGKKNITGIEYEPWHIRYVGKKAAKYIYDNKITLEEYLRK